MNKGILIIAECPARPLYLLNFTAHPYLGALYVVSFLESKGIKVDFFDRAVAPTKEIDFSLYDIIGFTVNVSNIENSLRTAMFIKRYNPKTKIVFGGPFASAYPEVLLKERYVDIFVSGEGEEAFYEYVSGIEKDKIKGLYFLIDGKLHFTGTRDWIQDLDALPFPALNKIDVGRYYLFQARKRPISSILTSRGCPYKCTYCYHALGKRWRARSPLNVVNEIEWQVKTLGVREILIYDDNFSFDMDRAKEIFDEIRRREIRVSLQLLGIRADLIDEEILKKGRDAGVWLIGIAPESGSLNTFRRLNKGFGLEDVEKVVRMAKDLRIATDSFFMAGFPWETEKDIKDTIRFALKLDTDFLTLSRLCIFSGTGLYDASHDNFDISHDRSYMALSEKSDDIIRKYFMHTYRRFYFSPKKMIRIVMLLQLYSLSKIMFVLRNLINNYSTKFNLFSMLKRKSQQI